MVVLPPGFVATRYPGYFWYIPQKKLYSLKTGVLKPLKIKKSYRFHPEGYRIYTGGFKRFLSLDYLYGLKYPKTPEMIPIAK